VVDDSGYTRRDILEISGASLAAITGATSLAGCSDNNSTNPTETPTNTPTSEPTPTETETAEEIVEILESQEPITGEREIEGNVRPPEKINQIDFVASNARLEDDLTIYNGDSPNNKGEPNIVGNLPYKPLAENRVGKTSLVLNAEIGENELQDSTELPVLHGRGNINLRENEQVIQKMLDYIPFQDLTPRQGNFRRQRLYNAKAIRETDGDHYDGDVKEEQQNYLNHSFEGRITDAENFNTMTTVRYFEEVEGEPRGGTLAHFDLDMPGDEIKDHLDSKFEDISSEHDTDADVFFRDREEWKGNTYDDIIIFDPEEEMISYAINARNIEPILDSVRGKYDTHPSLAKPHLSVV